jgi:hypothetical protein
MNAAIHAIHRKNAAFRRSHNQHPFDASRLVNGMRKLGLLRNERAATVFNEVKAQDNRNAPAASFIYKHRALCGVKRAEADEHV